MIATPAYFRRKFKDFLGSIPPRPRGAGFPLAYLMKNPKFTKNIFAKNGCHPQCLQYKAISS